MNGGNNNDRRSTDKVTVFFLCAPVSILSVTYAVMRGVNANVKIHIHVDFSQGIFDIEFNVNGK